MPFDDRGSVIKMLTGKMIEHWWSVDLLKAYYKWPYKMSKIILNKV